MEISLEGWRRKRNERQRQLEWLINSGTRATEAGRDVTDNLVAYKRAEIAIIDKLIEGIENA